eukprot:1376456-Amorphochlora_amoeboformis.AAC.1
MAAHLGTSDAKLLSERGDRGWRGRGVKKERLERREESKERKERKEVTCVKTQCLAFFSR